MRKFAALVGGRLAMWLILVETDTACVLHHMRNEVLFLQTIVEMSHWSLTVQSYVLTSMVRVFLFDAGIVYVQRRC